MAFTPETFVLCSKFNLFKAHANLWIYTTMDTLDDCLAEHYFQPRLNLKNQDSPEVGDVIQCIVEGSKLAYLKIVGKTEKPYHITVARTFLENEAVIIAELAQMANKTTDFSTPITDENLGITQAEQAELEDRIELAANSGRMITSQGLWYAKMYSATVAPSAEDGTNYADFSQVDGQGNPIIVTYNRVNGVWVQDQTITPPAEYDGYVPITSKIWDIPEQDGQQGGRILWNHASKEFTPYPQIVSFDSVELTGDSTVVMPVNPDGDNIANVDFVLDHVMARNVGDIFYTSRTDSILNGAVPCDGNSYQTTDFSGAQAPGTLLQAGKLPYVSLATYASLLASNGSVGVFGWDGIGTTEFKVPTLTDIFIETGTAAQVGDYLAPGLPDHTHSYSKWVQQGSNGGGSYTAVGYSATDSTGNASASNSIYGNSNTVQPNAVRYRAMIQLSSGVSDQSVVNLATVAYTGDYGDLLNKPTIPAAQVNSDWNAASGVAQILNKPTLGTMAAENASNYTPTANLATVATSGSYNDLSNKPTIPTVNDSTITITQGGVTKGTFTTNQGSASTIALDAGGGSPKTINANVVGSLTINGADVSGFSNSNYLQVSGFDFYGASSFEIVVAFTTPTNVDTGGTIINGTASSGNSFNMTIHQSVVRAAVIESNVQQKVTGVTELSANTKYYAKFSYDGTNYTLSLSTDGINYTQEATSVATKFVPQGIAVYDLSKNSGYPMDALHMDGWYVKVNNSVVWEGMVGHDLIAFQAPTADNNYTWYRKYADGWVEQGGMNITVTSTIQTWTLPVTMADTHYAVQFCKGSDNGNYAYAFPDTVSTIKYKSSTGSNQTNCAFVICGMAA